MDLGRGPTTREEADWLAFQQRWTQGWRRVVFPTVFLLYLVFAFVGISNNVHGVAETGADLVVAAFICCYLTIMLVGLRSGPAPFARRQLWHRWSFWVPYIGMYVALGAVLPFAHASGFVLALYITAISVGVFRGWAIPVVVTLTLAALIVPVGVTSWHVSLLQSVEDFLPLAIPIVALITYGIVRVQGGNLALIDARSQVSRLATENERNRIARDLHDLLGHSLTSITIKSALAQRLASSDPDQAVREMAEVEALSRQALTDVRAAVAGYKDVTLLGELARGRELLRASGIDADFPQATDMVDQDHQELFGWAVREGLTNVARHARATRCAVTIAPAFVEIWDDGIGSAPVPSGNGLLGLRERARAAGGSVHAGPVVPHGWRLRIELGAATSADTSS